MIHPIDRDHCVPTRAKRTDKDMNFPWIDNAMVRIHRFRRLNAGTVVLAFCLMTILIHGRLKAQDGVGLPFLKIGIGARQAGMAGVATGVGDDVYTVYTNPGGLGHIRRWQWSAAYNKWFADVYQASFIYVQQFRAFGSKKMTIGLDCSYIGMPAWDATGGLEPEVSANQLIAGVHLGQRLDWLTPALALGAGIKGISSRYADYSALGVAGDVGLLLRPGRFELGTAGLGIFDYGIITLGVSYMHLGPKIKFDRRYTSLPRTWRAGVSFRMGRYNGFNLLLASDVIGVQNRDAVIGFGTELWWKDVLGARFGYRMNEEDLGDISFGLGFRWDDVMNSIFNLPTRYGDAFEVNVADVGYGDVLQQTYRGAVSHFPVAPEPFRLQDPTVITSQVMGDSSAVTLAWEKAYDPDPFDEVAYLVFIDKDRNKVDQAIAWVERNMDDFLQSGLKDSLLLCESVPSPTFVTSVVGGGVYYWAVAAYDLGRHARLAKRGEEHIDIFTVATADLAIQDFHFIPTEWITTTPEQGILSITVANEGSVESDSFHVIITDGYEDQGMEAEPLKRTLVDVWLPGFSIGTDTTFIIDWVTNLHGSHVIRTVVDPESRILELNHGNNDRSELIVSVPKGLLSAPDSIDVMATGYDQTEIPIVPEVYFQPFSSEIDPLYYTDSIVSSPILLALARRLIQHPEISVIIRGSIDALSGEEDPALADERGVHVRGQLIRMGVPDDQINVEFDHPEKILGQRRMPADPQDAEWVMQQNRVVRFTVDPAFEELVFSPFKVAVDTTLIRDGIQYGVDIITPSGIDAWRVTGGPAPIEMVPAGLFDGDSLRGRFIWNGSDVNGNLVPRNRWVRYHLVLDDTLGRTFRTREDSVYLKEKRTLQRWEMFGAAKFAEVEPIYQFYWDRLMDLGEELVQNPDMRVRFEGHACAIGSDAVNQRLSLGRAEAFTRAFKERIRNAYPGRYEDIWRRIDQPVGYGEKVPLDIRVRGQGDLLLGDNETPVGRYLNRRIMVLLYKEN